MNIYIYPNERIAGAGLPHTRAHVLRPSARACVRVRLGIRADTCERLSPAWTAGGSARRRSLRRRRSTRTSARGTSPQCQACTMYAPPFLPGPARRRTTAGGTTSAGRRCGAGRFARRDRRCSRARVCADMWARAFPGVHVCRYSCAHERRDTCMYLCICLYVCIIHIYMYIGIHVLV